LSAPVLSRLFNALRKQAAGASTNNPFSPAQQEQPHRTSASGPRKVQTQPHVGRHKLSEKTLRPNPQSQSFSRSYGSILPTSLIYILLSTRGC